MSLPQIRTAIPQRRYQFGEFLITVLGEIESKDDRDYLYMLAVGREGDARPNLFVSSEKNGEEGRFAMRVSMPDGSQVIDESDQWDSLEIFVRDALNVVQTMLNLGDERPYQLD